MSVDWSLLGIVGLFVIGFVVGTGWFFAQWLWGRLLR